MKRIGFLQLALAAVLSTLFVGTASATPLVNGATIETRTFNDCPLSTVTTTNNYPASIQITDAMFPGCAGFANLHSFSFSADGGTTAAAFNNDANFRFSADFKIEGAGEGEGGLRISPWYGQFVDGRMMANATTGEIACFGGALPFYSFTVNNGITYTRGTTIHFEVTYLAHHLTSAFPATIQYRVIYNGNTYDSPVLPFGSQNLAECVPHGLWGMLNDGRAGGYFQPRANTSASLTATWTNIQFACLPSDATPAANGATIETRTFNDCPLSTVTTTNNYPASIQITDAMFPGCAGFANLHSFSFSADGGTTAAVFDNDTNFHFGADFRIDGAGEGEGGLRVSPWYGQFVDGRMMANATTGEIACFGGAIPFYSFTVNHGITYARGTTIHFEITYRSNDLVSADPATIQYRVIYNGNTYDSPVLPFGSQNLAECDHGLWGMLNDGRVGGYFQPRANTSASLTATWSNISYTGLAPVVALTLEPSVLNLTAHGRWVTAILQPAAPFAASDIDASSLQLNGVPVDAAGPSTIGDFNSDGIPDLSVKFSRTALSATLSAGNAVNVTVTGTIGGECFSATEAIKAKSRVLDSPRAAAIYSPGSPVSLRWDKDADYPTVSILSTLDNGQTWKVEARGIPNSGRYTWTAPATASTRARVGVAVIAAVDAGGIVTSAEFGESGAFSISAPTGVGGSGAVALAIRQIIPNPARGEFSVHVSVPGDEPATLTVYDLNGRAVWSRALVPVGEGEQAVTFGRGATVRNGVYQVRLTQAGRSVTRSVTMIR